MTLSTKNYLVRYYDWMFGSLPADICSFFWATLMSILLFFLFLPGRVVSRQGTDISIVVTKSLVILVFLVFSIGIGNVTYILLGYEEPGTVLRFLLMTLIGAGVLGTIILIIVGLVFFFSSEPDLFKETIGNTYSAVRGKYCTKISYRDV